LVRVALPEQTASLEMKVPVAPRVPEEMTDHLDQLVPLARPVLRGCRVTQEFKELLALRETRGFLV
jgi:hypothetical protein